jgi:hypothetical protein
MLAECAGEEGGWFTSEQEIDTGPGSAGARAMGIVSLKARIAQVRGKAVSKALIFLGHPLHKHVERELGANPYDFRSFLSRLLFAAQLGIVNNQITVGAQVIRVAGEMPFQHGNCVCILPHLCVDPAFIE